MFLPDRGKRLETHNLLAPEVASELGSRFREDVSTMRLPRPRFTVRRLMLLIAIAGLAMGGGVWDADVTVRRFKVERRHGPSHSSTGTLSRLFREA